MTNKLTKSLSIILLTTSLLFPQQSFAKYKNMFVNYQNIEVIHPNGTKKGVPLNILGQLDKENKKIRIGYKAFPFEIDGEKMRIGFNEFTKTRIFHPGDIRIKSIKQIECDNKNHCFELTPLGETQLLKYGFEGGKKTFFWALNQIGITKAEKSLELLQEYLEEKSKIQNQKDAETINSDYICSEVPNETSDKKIGRKTTKRIIEIEFDKNFSGRQTGRINLEFVLGNPNSFYGNASNNIDFSLIGEIPYKEKSPRQLPVLFHKYYPQGQNGIYFLPIEKSIQIKPNEKQLSIKKVGTINYYISTKGEMPTLYPKNLQENNHILGEYSQTITLFDDFRFSKFYKIKNFGWADPEEKIILEEKIKLRENISLRNINKIIKSLADQSRRLDLILINGNKRNKGNKLTPEDVYSKNF